MARFSLALGDALDPTVQARTLAEDIAERRFVHEGHLAMAFLDAAVEPDRVFDAGSHRAFKLLERIA